jgi:hypothetical protein
MKHFRRLGINNKTEINNKQSIEEILLPSIIQSLPSILHHDGVIP